MTTIHTTIDLVRALREQPEFMETVRALVLTEELLALPARFDRLVATVDTLAQSVREYTERTDRRLASLETGVGELQTGMGELQTDVAELQTGVGELQTDVGELQTGVGELQTSVGELQTGMGELQTDVGELQTGMGELQTGVGELQTDVGELQTGVGELQTGVGTLNGWFLEQRVRNNLLNIAKDELGLTRGRVLADTTGDIDPQLRAAITEAESQGLVTEDQVDNLEVADVVIRARRTGDRKYVYAVGEISRTIGNNDIDRARDRSDTLATVTGDEVIAIVIGGIIQPPQRALADLRNVRVIIPAMLEEDT